MLSTDFWNGLNGVDPLVRRFNPFNPLPESVDSILIKKPSTHLKHTQMVSLWAVRHTSPQGFTTGHFYDRLTHGML